jgi:hypothetical protein
VNLRVPFLWLCGPSGVGKTAAGWEIFQQLASTGSATAYVDADQLGLCYPSSPDDPYNHRLKARNLGAVWAAFRAAGAESVVMSGGIEVAEQIDVYASQVPEAALTLCRLRAGRATLTDRFIIRGWMPNLVDLAVAEADELDRLDFADLCVDTDGLAIAAVAQTVRERVGGWPKPTLAPDERASDLAAGAGASDVAGGERSGAVASDVTGAVGMDAAAFDATGAVGMDAAASGAGGEAVPVLLLCGAAGVGKSTVGYTVFSQINADVKAAYVDLAQIGFCHPAPPDDPDNHRLKATILAAMWPAFRDAGARCLIVVGRVNDDAAISVYAKALQGMALTVCRLHAGRDALTDRILRRGRGEGAVLAGEGLRGKPLEFLHEVAERAVRESEELQVGDVCIDTDGRSVAEVAGLVRERFGR